jgi:hypothetical protein
MLKKGKHDYNHMVMSTYDLAGYRERKAQVTLSDERLSLACLELAEAGSSLEITGIVSAHLVGLFALSDPRIPAYVLAEGGVPENTNDPVEMVKRLREKSKDFAAIALASGIVPGYLPNQHGQYASIFTYQLMNQAADLLEALAFRRPVVPQGWVMVPEEPTRDMVWAGSLEGRFTPEEVRTIYRAMLSAAQVSSGTKGEI